MLSSALLLAAGLALANDGGSAGPDSLSSGAKKEQQRPHAIGTRDGGAKAQPPGPAPVGNLSKDEITKVLKRHQNEVRHCYEQALRLKPELAGKIAVKFIVGATGDVLDSEIASDTLNDENLKACMLKLVRSWKFPEPRGGGNVTITYPWVFNPTEPAKK